MPERDWSKPVGPAFADIKNRLIEGNARYVSNAYMEGLLDGLQLAREINNRWVLSKLNNTDVVDVNDWANSTINKVYNSARQRVQGEEEFC